MGYTRRQSVGAGLLLVPMAGLAIGLVQTTSDMVPALGSQIAAVVLGAVAVFETIGPPLAAFALRLTGEAREAVKPAARTARAANDAVVGAPPTATNRIEKE